MLLNLAQRYRARIGIPIAVSASAAYGGSQVLEKWIVINIAPPIVTSAFTLMFGVTFLFILFHRTTIGDVRRTPKKSWFFMAAAGLTSTSAVLFLLFALSKSPVVLVSPMIAINPIITLTLTHFFLQRLEHISLRLVIGTLLIIGGAAIITVSAVT